MSTPTQTPQPSAMCSALARSLMIWIKQDGVGHEFVAHQLAELESIVSADMQARAEAAERTVSEQQAEWDKLLNRVEAAEALAHSHLAELISAGNAMRYGVWVNGKNPLAVWDEVVSGAHAGAKGKL